MSISIIKGLSATGELVSLRLNDDGSLPVTGGTGSTGGGSGGDSSAANQLTEIQRLEQLRDRIPADGAREANQLIEIQRLEQVRDRLPATGVAKEATLDLIRANLPSASIPVLTRTLSRKWRDDFNGTALTDDWQLVQQGSGQTVAVTNSELRITAGLTANAETIIRSTKTSSIAFRTIFIASLSQRIANQDKQSFCLVQLGVI